MKTYQNSASPPIADDTLKTTALLYLREALWSESYEDCAELILGAKTFGARPDEIGGILNDYLRAFPSKNGASKNNKPPGITTRGE